MKRSFDLPFDVKDLPTLRRNAGVAFKNALAALPGERPKWLVVELSGAYPARERRRKLLTFPPELGPQDDSLESLQKTVRALAAAPWLDGVVFRLEGLDVNLTTAYALGRLVDVLKRAGKRTVCYLTRLDLTRYYVAASADEVVMPPGAELFVTGLALETTFMRDALARFGVSFDKLAIKEYKNAGDQFVRQEMSAAQREQLEALLASLEATVLERISAARNTTPETVRGWIDEGVTSAARALELGMIDRVAYEDELLDDEHKPLAAASRFLRREPQAAGKGVAVVSLLGVIVTGKSQRSPVPLPLVGALQAGSDTLLAAFRAAEKDERIAAIVFYVDSGGGSALASDLIWREVARIKSKKPVVAVMGSLAASGGYYVLTHADHVIAAPTTLTGSIGVVTAKPVLEGFNDKYGFNPEAVRRGRFALTFSSSHPFDDAERALVTRSIEETYGRFVGRVAEGRGLTPTRVNELGRGRIWSGRDALSVGLVDELGDIETGVARAKDIAGLRHNAPVRNVTAPAKLLLPSTEDPTTFARTLNALQRERILLLHDPALKIT